MNSIRCTNCGLVSFATAAVCRRCGASIAAPSEERSRGTQRVVTADVRATEPGPVRQVADSGPFVVTPEDGDGDAGRHSPEISARLAEAFTDMVAEERRTVAKRRQIRLVAWGLFVMVFVLVLFRPSPTYLWRAVVAVLTSSGSAPSRGPKPVPDSLPQVVEYLKNRAQAGVHTKVGEPYEGAFDGRDVWVIPVDCNQSVRLPDPVDTGGQRAQIGPDGSLGVQGEGRRYEAHWTECFYVVENRVVRLPDIVTQPSG